MRGFNNVEVEVGMCLTYMQIILENEGKTQIRTGCKLLLNSQQGVGLTWVLILQIPPQSFSFPCSNFQQKHILFPLAETDLSIPFL